MLRITTIETDDATLLKAEGRIIGRWIDAVRDACRDARSHQRRVLLDLSGVSFVEPEGIALLHHLQDEAVCVINPTPFVTEQMRG